VVAELLQNAPVATNPLSGEVVRRAVLRRGPGAAEAPLRAAAAAAAAALGDLLEIGDLAVVMMGMWLGEGGY
jgi:hypothetical protein